MHTRAAAVGTSAEAITSLAKALEPSSAAASRRRAEAADPTGTDGVGDPGDQGGLRTDDDQVGVEPDGEVGHGVAVERVDRVQLVAKAADPRVARRHVHLGDGRVAGEGQGEGVLAATGADDEGLHSPDPIGADAGDRPGTVGRTQAAPRRSGRRSTGRPSLGKGRPW